MKRFIVIFGKLCLWALVIITKFLLDGFVIMKLWQWFIVYAFAVQPINLIQSIGLVLIWKYLLSENKDGDKNFTEQFIKTLLRFGITLGLGYLITLFQ